MPAWLLPVSGQAAVRQAFGCFQVGSTKKCDAFLTTLQYITVHGMAVNAK
jgi:hypothetical protein